MAVSLLVSLMQIFAQAYSGPAPAKTDLPYLLHADTLVATEVVETVEAKGDGGSTLTIPGAASRVKTPLASPIFIFKNGELNPVTFQVLPLISAGGHREANISAGKNAKIFTLTVKKLTANLYRLEVNESLPAGEYAMVPGASRRAFCFAVY